MRLVEDDPNESVGYGGRPDRDGRFTLDACIMDEKKANIGSVASLEHIKINFCSQSRDGKNASRHVSWRWSITICGFSGFEKINLLTPESKKNGKIGSKHQNINLW